MLPALREEEAIAAAVLQRLVVQAHARNVAPNGATSISDKTVKDYSVYKPYLILYATINALYNTMFKVRLSYFVTRSKKIL